MPAKDWSSASGKPGGSGASRPSQADWRRGGKTPAPGVSRPGTKAGGWWENPDQPYRHARRWYWIRVAALLLVCIGFTAWLVSLLLFRPVRTPFCAVAVIDYGAGRESQAVCLTPPNAWAEEDLQRFSVLGSQERILQYSRASYAAWESKASALQELREAIARTKGGGPKQNVVIVYLSMHGAVDRQGEPCLLPPGASPYRSDDWLPLGDLLEYLFPKDAQSTLPEKKLLILDCNRLDAQWALGLLYNGFADRLEAVRREANIPGLVILNSASGGQVGWASPEQLKGSVFGYFLWQGLRGAADNRQEGGNGDKQVSLLELDRYLKANVRQWVQENRADVQQPMLVPGDAEDFPLVFAKSSQPTSIPAVDRTADPRWQQIEALWREHQALGRRIPYRVNPLGWEEFQHKLLWLEQLASAGKACEDQFSKTKKRLDELTHTLAQDPLPPHLAAYNLPLALQLSRQPKVDEDRQQLRAGWNKTAGKFQPEAGRQYAYLAAAAEVWNLCLGGVASEHWPQMLQLVDQASQQGKADFDLVELHFLRALAGYLDPQVWKADPQCVQLALTARDLAERAAAPSDRRVHYWLQPLVDQADQQRRLAEDHLFVGSSGSLRDASQLYGKLTAADGTGASYPAALTLADKVGAAFALRDRAWAETPYFAQWLLARSQEADPSQLDNLAQLIQSTHDLAVELDKALPGAQWTAGLETALRVVESRLTALEKAFRQQCAQLWESAGADRKTLKSIAAVLDVPLATGEERNRLRRKYLQIAAAAADGQGARHLVAPGQQEATASRQLDRLTRQAEHPALAILSRAKLESDQSKLRAGAQPAPTPLPPGQGAETAGEMQRKKLIAQQGEQVRRLLDGVRADAERLLRDAAQKLKRQENLSSGEMREGYSQADQLVRASAALMALDQSPWSDPGTDPVYQLQAFDLHSLLLWQARRTLDDFWGPAPGRGKETSFFASAAEQYLKSAQELCKEAASLRYAKASLPELLAARKQAAQAGVVPKARDLAVDEDEPSAKLEITVAMPENLPAGEAAVYLRNPKVQDAGQQLLPVSSTQKQQQADLRRMAVPVGNGQRTRQLESWVSQSDLPADADRLEAVALYRGHQYPRALTVERSAAGLDIEYERPVYPKPTITVNGQVTQGTSIMFILDYSGSMSQEMLVTVEGKKYKTSRFIEARKALNRILERLVGPDNPYRIGLRVYGHRVGWDTSDQNKIVCWDPKNPERLIAQPVEMKLHPRDDVELILELGAFTESDKQKVRDELEALKPLGETPLYLAILQAIEDLRRGPKAPQRHIVAITDGVNWRSDKGREDEILPKDVEDALRRPGNDDIRLDIVGFRITEEDLQAEVQQVQDPARRAALLQDLLQRFQDLKDLAAKTGGAFYQANDPSSLIRALEKSLQLSQYLVERVRGGPALTPEPVELNKTTVIQQSPDVKVPYLVRINDPQRPAQAEVALEGGESLELYLSKDRSRLEHRRYQEGLRQPFPNVADPSDGKGQRRFFVAAHLPVWDRDAVRFLISIQNAVAEDFSPRPAEAWAEIRPVLPPGSAAERLYVFYDLKYEFERPVPVLAYRATNWPAEAKEAEVQLWFKLQKTEPEPQNVLAVGELQRRGQFRIDGLPDVSFELEAKRGQSGAPFRVVITERHPSGSRLNAVKVEMDPCAWKVIHRYNPKTATVRHTFFYDDSAAAKIAAYAVRFTTRESLVRGAVSLPEPLKIDIPRRGALVTP